MDLKSYDNARDFYGRAAAFLLRHEAEHNLILGLCDRLRRDPGYYDQPPYLATVEEGGGEVVAAALMTPPWNLTLSRVERPGQTGGLWKQGQSGVLPLIAQDLRRRYDALPGVLGPVEVSRAFTEEWGRVSGQAYRRGVAERIYQLDAVVPVTGVPGRARRAVAADRDLAVAWMRDFSREALGDDNPRQAARMVDARLAGGADAGLLFWDDGGPMSMAGYSGPTPRGIRVGPVYTPPAHRGKGYASACVAALSGQLLDESRAYCFLYTDLGNPTSNRIYQAIGYRPVCDVDEYRFS